MDLLEATVDGRLDELPPPEWDPRPAVCVVMASEGYPGNFERGQPIRGLDEAAKLPDVKVFHAGTALRDGQVVTDGGRVLGVTALGSSISAAKLQAYKACEGNSLQRRLVPQGHQRQGAKLRVNAPAAVSVGRQAEFNRRYLRE